MTRPRWSKLGIYSPQAIRGGSPFIMAPAKTNREGPRRPAPELAYRIIWNSADESLTAAENIDAVTSKRDGVGEGQLLLARRGEVYRSKPTPLRERPNEGYG